MPIPPPRSNGMPPASLKPDSSAIFLLENGENGTKTKVNGKNVDGDSGGSENEESAAKLPRRSTKEWLSKYFWEGQKLQGLEETGEKFQLPPDATFEQKLLTKYRNWIALLIPVSIVQFMWWTSAIKFNWFSLYETHYQMPLTMILGSIIAGMTSEGGGAVAFPVMTFILHIKPHVARDFSIMVQAVGMSMALFVILFMRIQIEWRAIIFGTFGAIPGALLGFTFLEPLFTPRAEKMLFVSIWSSFAISLWILNREKKRKTFTSIQQFNVWKSAVLILTGFIGGIFTSFAGSGVDICTFSTLTLLFSVSEKIATPTTVVIMAINSQFCYYWRAVMMNDGISELAYNYIKVTIPVTSFAAPFGSFLGSHFHRQTLAYLVYILELISYIAFLFTAPPLQLIVASILIIASGFAFFRLMGKWGKKLMLIAAAREELGIVGNGSPKKLLLAKKASAENVDF